MVFGKKTVCAGLLAVGLVTAGRETRSQNTTTQQNGSPTQNSVPDAPRPQSLPKLNSITPVGPAYPSAPVGSSSSTTAPGGDQDVPSSLPSTPKPTAGAQAQAQDQQGAPPDLPTAADSANVFKLKAVQVNFVQIPFTVKDSRGQLVPGLTWRDVKVYENGLFQPLAVFSTDPLPLSVALVIDQSVTFDTMAKINNSLTALQGAFSPYDEVSIFTYNNGVRQQTAFTAAQSARLGAVLERTKAVGREPNMYMGGPLDTPMSKNNLPVDPNINRGQGAGTSVAMPSKEYHTLNDAILAAAQETTKAARGQRRRIVYVISDGKEYGSKATQKEVIRYLQTNEVTVYATLVGDSGIPGLGFLDRIHLPYTMRDDALPRYAAATGGQCDPEFRQRGIEQSFAKITEQVRAAYTVGYYSHEPILDGKFRSVDVRVMRPSLTVIAKPGYYPTPRNSRPATSVPMALP
jgi:VWFA-related protein